jgi:Signal recognition particle receptor beta subunit
VLLSLLTASGLKCCPLFTLPLPAGSGAAAMLNAVLTPVTISTSQRWYRTGCSGVQCAALAIHCCFFGSRTAPVACRHLYAVLRRLAQQPSRRPLLLACNKSDLSERAFSQDFIVRQLEKELYALLHLAATSYWTAVLCGHGVLESVCIQPVVTRGGGEVGNEESRKKEACQGARDCRTSFRASEFAALAPSGGKASSGDGLGSAAAGFSFQSIPIPIHVCSMSAAQQDMAGLYSFLTRL